MAARSTTLFLSAAVFCGTVLAGSIFGVTLAHAFLLAPSSADSETSAHVAMSPQETPTHVSMGTPVRLSIPAISVDAAIQPVSIAASGNMAVPRYYMDVGWYRLGPEPGEPGSAVIDGHVDDGIRLPAVFVSLGELHPGDQVFVTRSDGTQLAFAVTDVETYAENAVPLERIFDANGPPQLNLISCKGGWAGGRWTYQDRTVVYTTLINS